MFAKNNIFFKFALTLSLLCPLYSNAMQNRVAHSLMSPQALLSSSALLPKSHNNLFSSRTQYSSTPLDPPSSKNDCPSKKIESLLKKENNLQRKHRIFCMLSLAPLPSSLLLAGPFASKMSATSGLSTVIAGSYATGPLVTAALLLYIQKTLHRRQRKKLECKLKINTSKMPNNLESN